MRAAAYAVAVARCARPLVESPEYGDAGRQLRRASSSGAANYRGACLARSRKEFIAKLGVAIEETDESIFWLEHLTALDAVAPGASRALIDEGSQLLRIFKASRDTAKRNGGG
jgi:four helix bundle protein